MTPIPDGVRRLADAAVRIAGVKAVTLGGSHATGMADAGSDIDLHVYWRSPLAAAADRAAVLAPALDEAGPVRELTAWGLEDHAILDGVPVELVYVELDPLRAEIDRAIEVGLDGEAFATAVLHSVTAGPLLADPDGELASLRARLAEYPPATYRRQLDVLPGLLHAYLGQLTKARSRGDLLFVQHRRYSVQLVWFALLFALNRRYHPGEKRLLDHGERCAVRVAGQRERWEQIAEFGARDPRLPTALAGLVADLVALIPEGPAPSPSSRGESPPTADS
ncbi:MAG: DUF4037 domain-containing protein [Kineosporiaceae bacterium]|nr:DUF4037 domain-containing protein [Kineosporiaceae bacterium]